jgi:hypothetical protein
VGKDRFNRAPGSSRAEPSLRPHGRHATADRSVALGRRSPRDSAAHAHRSSRRLKEATDR